MNGQVPYNLFLPSLVRKTGVSQRPCGSFVALQLFLNPFDIFETQFCLDDLHIAYWVHVALNVGDFVIIEGTDNLEYSIDRSHV